MSADGIVTMESDADYQLTLLRLEEALAGRGIKPMARVDHAAGAATSGLSLPPMLLIVFGNPKVGTILMQERPSFGLDLPLKILVWEEGKTARIGYNDASWLASRHGGVTAVSTLDGMNRLLHQLACAATGRSCE